MEEIGSIIRPFSTTANVQCRGCSRPLQRVVVDFAADVSFQRVPAKLEEHYDIFLAVETIRTITLKHAKNIHSNSEIFNVIPNTPGVKQIISETDGSMIPIVTTIDDPLVGDKRKTCKTSWREARLCFGRDSNSIEAVFRATIGSVEETGDLLFDTVIKAGMGTDTQVHCLGDGAPWIEEQVSRVFGLQGSYLVDFYHVCDYLAAAAETCTESDKKRWISKQKEHLRDGQVSLVLEDLKKHLEAPSIANDSAPVRACYRYLTNRLDQLNYRDALDKNLPIGSGEIERAHRHVVQRRMKLAGEWWKEENAEYMLKLQTTRANGEWKSYWGAGAQEEINEAVGF